MLLFLKKTKMGSTDIVKSVLGFGDPTVSEFVDSVLYVTKGDLWKLKCNYEEVNSVFGNISDKLCGKNRLLYRKWIHTIYTENKQHCKIKCIEKAAKRKSRLTPATETNPDYFPITPVRQGKAKKCGICQIRHDVDTEGTICSICHKWFDKACIGNVTKNYSEGNKFVCYLCVSGKLIRIPQLLQDGEHPDEHIILTENASAQLEMLEDEVLEISQRAENDLVSFALDGIELDAPRCGPGEGDSKEDSENADDVVKGNEGSDNTSITSDFNPDAQDEANFSIEKDEIEESNKSPTNEHVEDLPEDNPIWEDEISNENSITSDFGEDMESSQVSTGESDDDQDLPDTQTKQYSDNDLDSNKEQGLPLSSIGDEQKTEEDDPGHSTNSESSHKNEDSDTSNGDHDGEFIKYDVKFLRHITEFNFTIPWEDFEKIRPVKMGKDFKLQENWTDIFYKYFSERNAECNVMFRKHRVVSKFIRKNNSHITAEAYCKRKNCSGYYFFKVKSIPKENHNVLVSVKLRENSEIKHVAGEVYQRPVARALRTQAKEILRNKKAYNYKQQLLAIADPEKLNAGNYNEVQHTQKWKKIRSQARTEEELHHNVAMAVHMMQRQFVEEDRAKYSANAFKKVKLPGFIHHISLSPVMVVCHSTQQIQLLRKLIMADTKVCIHIDATSNIIARLPNPFCQDKIDVYMLAASSQISGVEPIVIAEFLTSDTSMPPINFFLSHILHSYRIMFKESDPFVNITRWETDFAPASITAILTATQFGTTLRYLQMSWDHLKSYTEMPVCIHVCKWHASRFIGKKYTELIISKCVKDEREQAKRVLGKLKYNFLNATTMEILCGSIEDFIFICGTEFLTEHVSQQIINALHNTRKTSGDWKSFNWKELASLHGPIKWNSPFSLYATYIARKSKIDIEGQTQASDDTDPMSSQLPRNTYYSPDFLDYLLTHVFPYASLLSRCILTLNKFTLEDTNNVAETANRMLKLFDFEAGELPMKLTRYIKLRKSKLDIKMKLWESAVELRTKLSAAVRRKENKCLRKSHASLAGDINFGKDVWAKKKKNCGRRIPGFFQFNLSFLPYGLQISVKGDTYDLLNTCSMDNTIVVLNYIYCNFAEAREFIKEKCASDESKLGAALLSMFDKYNQSKFEDVKKLWLIFFCEIREMSKAVRLKMIDRNNYTIDLFGSEQERGLSVFSRWIQIIKHYECPNVLCSVPLDEAVSTLDDFYASSCQSFLFALNQRTTRNCDSCGKSNAKCSYRFQFGKPPAILLYSVNSASGTFKEEDIPKVHKILKVKYDTLAYTVVLNAGFQNAHVITVFFTNTGKVCYDGLMNDFTKYKPSASSRVNIIWLVKS